MELYLHSPNTPSWRGTRLKHRTTLSTPRSSKRSTPSRFSDHFVWTSHLSYACYMTHPSHPLDSIIQITAGEAYKLWSSSLCSLLSLPPLPPLGPSILLSTLFSNILKMYVLPSVWETKFHTHTKQYVKYDFKARYYEQNDSKHSPNLICSLISSWMQFWLVAVLPKYLYFVTSCFIL